MKNHFGFFLTVNYSSPSTEDVFLGSGWGLRDVRGPYITIMSANINIPAVLFSSKIPSSIRMTLEASNRMKKDSAEINVQCNNIKITNTIGRNKKQEFFMYPIFAVGNTVCIDISLSKELAESSLFTEIIAIEDITIERIIEI